MLVNPINNCVLKFNEKNIIFSNRLFLKKRFLFIQENIDLFPTFKSLLKNSYIFKNLFSVLNPTEFTLPSIFSSSLFLDGKTYEYGIIDRDTI